MLRVLGADDKEVALPTQRKRKGRSSSRQSRPSHTLLSLDLKGAPLDNLAAVTPRLDRVVDLHPPLTHLYSRELVPPWQTGGGGPKEGARPGCE